MAHLARITIHPIKALPGITVPSSRFVRGGGLEHDRRLAIFEENGFYVNGKRDARVHGIRTLYDPQIGEVLLSSNEGSPERAHFTLHDLGGLQAWFSAYFARTLSVRRDEERGFPDDLDASGPTVIATATLREIASWFPGMSLDDARARFRATLEIDGVPPFWEDGLFGDEGTCVAFSIGDVVFEGVNPCARCIVPSRNAATGAEIDAFSKTFSERRAEALPPWAPASRFDHFYRAAVNTRVPHVANGMTIRVGDPVKISR
jgi:uncharacterized protein YcbX